MSNLVESIKRLVKNDCCSGSNLLDESFFDLHLAVVEKYSMELCEFFPEANKLVLGLASWLHDLSVIRDYGKLAAHNVESAKIAGELLDGKLDDAGLILLEDAITNHNMPYNDGSAESMILSNADAMSKLDYPVYWISYAYKRRFSKYKEAVKWYEELIRKTYKLLIPEAVNLVKEKYEAAVELIMKEINC